MRRLAFAIGVAAAVLLAGPAGVAQAECHDFHQSPTRVTHKPPPAGLLSRMAVLRRPQQAGDVPDVDFAHFPFRLLATDYIRKVAQVGRTKYYLIPASVSYPRLTRRCLRQLSPHRRRVEQRIEREARKRARTIGIGTFDFGGNGGGGSCCADAHALLANRTVMTTGGNDHSTVTAFVPDGVVSVTLRWHRGPERNATVSNNFWRTTVPLSAPRAFPHSTIWRDAAGHVVKSFREPGGR